jgi:hypothetical protein
MLDSKLKSLLSKLNHLLGTVKDAHSKWEKSHEVSDSDLSSWLEDLEELTDDIDSHFERLGKMDMSEKDEDELGAAMDSVDESEGEIFDLLEEMGE